MAVDLPPKGSYGATMPKPPRWATKGFTSLNVGFFRLFGKRMRVQGRPLLLLTTVGAKTGQVRQSVLGWFPESDKSWLIVASAAGAATHPAWLYNLAKNPDKVWIETEGRKVKVRPESLRGAEREATWIETEGRKVKVRPESLRGTEREAAWQDIAALAPGYGSYRTKTDREIPIIRLTQAE